MTKQSLCNRAEKDSLWYQRRSFLTAAAAWTATGGFTAAHAQQRSNIVELVGDAQLNGSRLLPQQTIQTGDQIATGPDTSLIFVVGNSSFKMRQNSRLSVERGASLNTVSLLRLLGGAVISVWGKGPTRQIVTPTLTAGIRGTGVYAEVDTGRDRRTYFCNCYGTVHLACGPDFVTSRSAYHQSFWGESRAKEGRYLRPAGAMNHNDEDLEYLTRLVDQRTAWQLLGPKGVRDGKGYMEDKPGQMHPAQTIGK